MVMPSTDRYLLRFCQRLFYWPLVEGYGNLASAEKSKICGTWDKCWKRFKGSFCHDYQKLLISFQLLKICVFTHVHRIGINWNLNCSEVHGHRWARRSSFLIEYYTPKDWEMSFSFYKYFSTSKFSLISMRASILGRNETRVAKNEKNPN